MANFIFVLVLGALALASMPATAMPTSTRQEVIEVGDPLPSFEPEFAIEPAVPVEPAVSAEPVEKVDLFSGLPTRVLTKNFKINCGGDQAGEYERDYYKWLTGTSSSFITSEPTVLESVEPVKIYTSHRFGLNKLPFSYELPLLYPGQYNCVLHFAETFREYAAVGARVFSVSATGNGETLVEENIDVFSETGGDISQTISRSFTIDADNLIKFEFAATAAEPMVSAIECDFATEVEI